MNNSLALAALLLSMAPAGAFAQAAAAPLSRIGAAAAVSGSVKAVAPSASVGRVIESGKPLFLNDHVTTDAAGRLQVLLLDETVFTLGPSSDMTLDEFVYDPKTSAGKVSAAVTKGAFRFVTGKVARAHPENMKVKLAVGTIGVRGTVVAGETSKEGSLVLNVGEGPNNNSDDRPSAIIVANAGVSRLVDQTGQGVKIQPGQAPSFPRDMAAEIQRISSILAAAPKDKAGKEPDDQSSAGQNSGQLTAAIKDLVNDLQKDEGDQSGANNASTIASQFGMKDGITSWDFIRANQPSGSGYYFSGEAPMGSCSGPGTCASATLEGSLQLQVNFSARTVGGSGGIFNPVSGQSGSFIHIHGVGQAGNGDTIQQLIGLGGSGLNPISFASLSGPATIALNSTTLGSLTTTTLATGVFNGSSVSLVNAGGVTAANALTHMVFTGSDTSSIAVSANGSFTSPKY